MGVGLGWMFSVLCIFYLSNWVFIVAHFKYVVDNDVIYLMGLTVACHGSVDYIKYLLYAVLLIAIIHIPDPPVVKEFAHPPDPPLPVLLAPLP